MADDHIMLFAVCIRKYREIVKLYIPAIDMETRAANSKDALNKARRLIQAALIINEVDKDLLSENNYSSEGLSKILKEKDKDEYQDAQIVYIEINTSRYEIGDLTVQIPQYLIDGIKSEDIDCTDAVKTMLEEILRKKRLFNQAKDLSEKTVSINNGDYIGKIESVKYKNDSPWNFSIKLKTGISDSIMLHSAMIDDIGEIPVVMNKLGTFHAVNQNGQMSLSGKLWWYKGHIDVYLEYDPSAELEDQKIFELLYEFNNKKYEIDEVVRKNIVKQLISRDEVLALFKDYDEDNTETRIKYIYDQLINRMELWFVDISLNNTVYMDYNFSNGIGKFCAGVNKKIDDDSFVFVLNDVEIFTDSDEDIDE